MALKEYRPGATFKGCLGRPIVATHADRAQPSFQRDELHYRGIARLSLRQWRAITKLTVPEAVFRSSV